MTNRATPKKLDALMLLIKASMAGRRRRSWLVTLLVILVLLLPVGFLVWWIWLSRSLPPLILVAYDQVTVANTPILLRGQVEPEDSAKTGLDLRGCNLFFLDSWGNELLGKVTTDRAGRGLVEGHFPEGDAQPVEFVIRCPGEKSRPGLEARGQVFVWPSESSLLIVDADHALSGAEQGTDDAGELEPLPGVTVALQAAVQRKYRVVYLTANADRPGRYLDLRARLQATVGSETPFPAGPVLSRANYPEATDAGAFYHTAIADLTKQFQGTAIGVTRRTETAQAFRDAGLKWTFLLIDDAEAPEGVTPIPSWAELPKRLPKD